MGQAKRRKVAGTYPELTPKPKTKTRIRRNVRPSEEYFGYFPMMFTTLAMLYGRRRNTELMQIQREMSN
jgi:hypothetical protein